MKEKVYNFSVQTNWNLINILRQIDRFDASWFSIEKLNGQDLKVLKELATIQSVGASTRIEGSKLDNEEVERLLNNLDISKMTDRDSQEVVGYFKVLDLIGESHSDIFVEVNNIKNLHNILLKFSQKDNWHRGDYKQHTNAVQATFADGSTQIIFRTTEPGFATEDAMESLVRWYNKEEKVHPLITCAAFVYDFLSIHPFQDGNGRLSRLLTTLLLIKSGYKWVEYVSFEHEIEQNKKAYYRALRDCQVQRPNEDITEWVIFFIESLLNIQKKLQHKLEKYEVENVVFTDPKEKEVWNFISKNPGCKINKIAQEVNIPKTTLKRIISELLDKNLIKKYGRSAGTNYAVN